MYRATFYFLFGLILFNCGSNNKNEIESMSSLNAGKYFIEVKTFNAMNNALDYKSKFHNVNEGKLHIFVDSTKGKAQYIDCIGPYNSSYAAGENAYSFFSKKIIDNYKIIRNLAPVYDEFSNLIFVGSYNGLNSLFNYNLKSDSVKLFWQKPGEKVIDLVGTNDTSISFFLTAKKTERVGIFPSITGVELYRIILPEERVLPVKYLGDAIQIFTGWIDVNSFKIIFNSFDKNVSTYVNQQTLIFNTSGKILSDISKTYDLVKEQYPELPGHDFYLKTKTKKRFIFSINQKAEQVEWIDDSFLVFSTNDISPANKSIFSNLPQTSTLTIYDLKNKRIINQWEKDGKKNFLFKSNFLFWIEIRDIYL